MCDAGAGVLFAGVLDVLHGPGEGGRHGGISLVCGWKRPAGACLTHAEAERLGVALPLHTHTVRSHNAAAATVTSTVTAVQSHALHQAVGHIGPSLPLRRRLASRGSRCLLVITCCSIKGGIREDGPE